jgi:hypothetical protein
MGAMGDREVQQHIDRLPEPRRSQMRHLHAVITAAMPGVEVRLWDYQGGLIGYGSYQYSNSKGPAGEWFAVGLANRKRYISLYSMAVRDGRYLVEAMADRFPRVAAGRSCLNITKPELIDDGAVRDLAHETLAQFQDRLLSSG